ncbi:MAG TPA: hypothetical protein VF035_03650, partial [Longimicrobiales bacterium]
IGSTFSPERVFVASDGVLALRAAGREAGTNEGAYEDLVDRIDTQPDRALALAAASTSLRSDEPVKRFGVVHDVVSFPWRNGRMRLELSRASHLPVAVETVRTYPHNLRWAAFGDVTIRTEYVNWTLQSSGITWPMQHKVTWNGEPWRDITVQKVALDATPVPSDSFAIGDSARAQFRAAAWQSPSAFRFGTRGTPVDIAPNIVQLPDFWAMTMVKQPDGVVLFEAHLSDTYFDEVLAEAQRRYPGTPVKAVVVTSDPWAHVGGIRQVVARGIPIYAHEASIPFLTRLVKTPHTLTPDLLQRSPRAPKFVAVSGKTVIGSGPERIELYPVGGPYAERMIMAHFPAQRAIYGSDLIFQNRGPDGKPANGFLATPARDLRRAIEREKLSADVVFCVQNGCAWDGAAFMRDESRPPAKPQS